MASDEAAKRRPEWAKLPAREVDVREGYALWAAQYDSERNDLLGPEAAAVDELLTPLRWTTALDAAGGTGRHLPRLARDGATVIALDQSPQMLARSVARCRTAGLAVQHVRGDLSRLPLRTEGADLVVCALALCHVPNLRAAVSELARVLQPGGHLLVTDFHPDSVEWGFRSEFVRRGVHHRLPNPGHTRAMYLGACTAAGLGVQRVIEVTAGEAGARRPRDLPPEYMEEFDRLRFLFACRAAKPS